MGSKGAKPIRESTILHGFYIQKTQFCLILSDVIHRVTMDNGNGVYRREWPETKVRMLATNRDT